jgi:ribosomal protein S12 methylthiotransferase
LADLAEELMAQRAADRLGETIDVLIEEEASPEDYFEGYTGRAAHQAPEVDGVTMISTAGPSVAGPSAVGPFAVGDMVRAVVTGSDGVDLTADVIAPSRR